MTLSLEILAFVFLQIVVVPYLLVQLTRRDYRLTLWFVLIVLLAVVGVLVAL
jgi:hypothetical protein